MSHRDTSERSYTRVVAEVAVVCIGIIVLGWAATTGNAWVDRHFLPDYFHPQPHRHDLALIARILTAGIALAAIVWWRPYIGRAIAAGKGFALAGSALRMVLAIGLALLASEAVLRTSLWRARHESPVGREPIQQADARLGWTLVPNHVGQRFIGRRTIEYVTDSSGYRVRCGGCAVDPALPSILFTGESIMLGTGLHWDESVPAQVGSLLGVQSVNLAVNGYASDQAYLRLAAELPRFRQPLVVVSLFMPSLIHRSLMHDRPYLDPALRWHPAIVPWRLQALADRLLNYSSTADTDTAIAMTRSVLQATAQLARSRHAAAIVLVPRFLPESAMESELRQRILDAGGIDYVLVDLDRSWRLADDAHPDARGARAMAKAVAARLRALGVGPQATGDGQNKKERPS